MALTTALRRACYRRDRWHCKSCNSMNGLHPHHIIWKSAGGPDTIENLLTLCWKCHNAVHDGFLSLSMVEGKPRFVRLRGWKP